MSSNTHTALLCQGLELPDEFKTVEDEDGDVEVLDPQNPQEAAAGERRPAPVCTTLCCNVLVLAAPGH